MEEVRGVMGGRRAEAGAGGEKMFTNGGDDEGNSGGVENCYTV